MAVFPKTHKEGAQCREKDGEGLALKPDLPQKPCVAWTRSCCIPYTAGIISSFFKLKSNFQADRLSAA